MAKKTKPSRQRRERIFEPLAAGNKVLVMILGALGALAMGAGVYGQFIGVGGEPFKYAPWILAGGAVLVGVAIWFGWSGDPVLRVGDAGIAVDRGGIRRMPWYAVERIGWGAGVVKVVGTDDMEQSLTIVAAVKSQPQAAAWIVKEAKSRVPSVVDVPDDAVPSANKNAGELVALEPMQLVGRKCAESGKVVAYEPDARICPKCDRVFHKLSVPETCKCGASLAQFHAKRNEAAAAAAVEADEVPEEVVGEKLG